MDPDAADRLTGFPFLLAQLLPSIFIFNIPAVHRTHKHCYVSHTATSH